MAEGHTVTMLAVDDEPDILEGFAMLLEQGLGVHVVTAPSGAEGLKILASTAVDLVISDYRMPGMDGCAFLEKAHRIAPGVPLVMVTPTPTPRWSAAPASSRCAASSPRHWPPASLWRRFGTPWKPRSRHALRAPAPRQGRSLEMRALGRALHPLDL
jgi:hypothetical protein